MVQVVGVQPTGLAAVCGDLHCVKRSVRGGIRIDTTEFPLASRTGGLKSLTCQRIAFPDSRFFYCSDRATVALAWVSICKSLFLRLFIF